MEAISREAFTHEVRDSIFSHFKLAFNDWRDLGGFESFVFANVGAKLIFRITHVSHRSVLDIHAELEFLSFLHSNGAPVCGPVRLADGNLVSQVGEFVCCQFTMAEGRLVTQNEWQAPLFERWGNALGQFHRLASHYKPTSSRRFDWRADANLDFRARVPASETKILGLADRYIAALNDLPTDPHLFGLIHSDAHPGNFFIHNENLTFFDFDDCCYQWFVFDVATILFGAVLRPWVGDSARDREYEAKRFLSTFLEGYAAAFEVPDFMLEHMSLFLKLRELSLYAVIHSQMDIQNLKEPFPLKVMQGRQERLEADLPFLDIDFASL